MKKKLLKTASVLLALTVFPLLFAGCQTAPTADGSLSDEGNLTTAATAAVSKITASTTPKKTAESTGTTALPYLTKTVPKTASTTSTTKSRKKKITGVTTGQRIEMPGIDLPVMTLPSLSQQTTVNTTAPTKAPDANAYALLKTAFEKTALLNAWQLSSVTTFSTHNDSTQTSIRYALDILCENADTKPFAKGAIKETVKIDQSNILLEWFFDTNGYCYQQLKSGENDIYTQENTCKYMRDSSFVNDMIVTETQGKLQLPQIEKTQQLTDLEGRNGGKVFTCTLPYDTTAEIYGTSIENILLMTAGEYPIKDVALSDGLMMYFVDKNGYIEEVIAQFDLVFTVTVENEDYPFYGSVSDTITFTNAGDAVTVTFPDDYAQYPEITE